MNQKSIEKLKKIVKSNYNEIADDFAMTRSGLVWPEVEKMVEKIGENDKVLDVGCGSGRLLNFLKKKKIDYLGIDNSAGLLENARKNYPKQKFIIGDILELNKATSEKYDFIFSLAVLHHVPTQGLRIQALKQMRERLEDDGQIFLSVWDLYGQKKYRSQLVKANFLKLIGRNKLDFGDLLFFWKNSQGEKVSQRYYHAFLKCELKKISRQAGLSVEEMYKADNNIYLLLRKD